MHDPKLVERAKRTVMVLRDGVNFIGVPNTVRQSMADVIEELLAAIPLIRAATLEEAAEEAMRKAEGELRGIQKEWPHYAMQARRMSESYYFAAKFVRSLIPAQKQEG